MVFDIEHSLTCSRNSNLTKPDTANYVQKKKTAAITYPQKDIIQHFSQAVLYKTSSLLLIECRICFEGNSDLKILGQHDRHTAVIVKICKGIKFKTSRMSNEEPAIDYYFIIIIKFHNLHITKKKGYNNLPCIMSFHTNFTGATSVFMA